MNARSILASKVKAILRIRKISRLHLLEAFSFCTSTEDAQKEDDIGGQKSLTNIPNDGQGKCIDYTILPIRRKKTEFNNNREKAVDEFQGELPTRESEEGVPKNKVKLFLKRYMECQENFRNSLQKAGLPENYIDKVLCNFKENLRSEIKEDGNLAFFVNRLSPEAANEDGIFDCLLEYIRKRYPLDENVDELKSISDLTKVASWFAAARRMKRKIVFHAGPTNSGKTYHALKSFQDSNSGIYGGPLRMLAAEVYSKTNSNGVKCDMITGEQRLYATSEFDPSDHVSCTVEMYNLSNQYDCAVIDEIQLLRDRERGWGWTNAFLGVQAKEVHVCGEPAAERVLKSLVKATGDELEVRRYKRLTPLHFQKRSLGNIRAIRPGDCVVAFSRQKIFELSAEIERMTNQKCSIIYGGLPPSIRLEQARRFNDPNCEQNILIASDAIGMGLNLSIRRLIFHSLRKFNGHKMIALPSYHAKQIAGRAGRFGTKFSEGYATTLRSSDLLSLRGMLQSDSDDVEKAGLRPSYEQIEMLSHVLPKASLADLLDAFVLYAKLDGNYFLCDVEHTKKMAEAISHVPLTLQQRYHLASAATDRTNKSPFITQVVIKMATLFSEGKAIGPDEMKLMLDWPLKKPSSSHDLYELESIHDVFDLHLWLSYKYEAIFMEREAVRELQNHVEELIERGIDSLSKKNRTRNKRKSA